MKYIITTFSLLSLTVLAGCQSNPVSVNTNTGNKVTQNGNENTEVVANVNGSKNENINISGEEKVQERRGHQTIESSCFDMIQNHEFIDPNQVYYIQHIESLEPLAVEWPWGYICESTDKSGYVVFVNKPYQDDERSANAFERTNKVYREGKNEFNESYDSYYHAYYFTDRLIEITYDGVTKQYQPGELNLITDLAWVDGLASCWIQPGNFIVDGGVVIACGHGDNGCSEAGYVSWNILTGESKYFGLCTNNCDLAEDQAFTLECK